jgi:hypothetical protein
VRAAVVGDRVVVRGLVDLETLGISQSLGPLGRVLPRQEWVELAGTIAVAREGVGEFRVERVQAGELPLPGALIPQLLQRLGASSTVAGDVVTIALPRHIADVRVARGRITLYKNVP